MCEKLVGLGEVDLVGINDPGEEAPLEVVIGSRKARPLCVACGGSVWSKGYRSVVLVDLVRAALGVIRPTRTEFAAVENQCLFVSTGLPQWCLSSFSSSPRTR